jgi:hypothetical protein
MSALPQGVIGDFLVPGDGTVSCKTKLCDDIAEALAVTRADTDMGIRMDRMGASKRRRLLREPSDKSVQIEKQFISSASVAHTVNQLPELCLSSMSV